MAFEDKFRLSSHAVITNDKLEVLVLKANYGDGHWGLPGGALELGETIHEALLRECREEINCEITIEYLSGVYYHSTYNSQAFIFRCNITAQAVIELSNEHTQFKYQNIESMSAVQQQRVKECLAFKRVVVSAKF
jgi:8-oxo-dGTP pyrophosphatase MutT (NUDIX family)